MLSFLFTVKTASYFNQDYAGAIDKWVKEPSSIKIFMGENGETRYEGWEHIDETVKKEVEDNTWYMTNTTMPSTFSLERDLSILIFHVGSQRGST